MLGVGNVQPASVIVSLDRGSGVTTISAELLVRMQAPMPGLQLTEPFQGQARVRTALREESTVDTQTYPMYLTMKSLWGRAHSRCHCCAPRTRKMVIIGKLTLHELFGIDVKELHAAGA